MLSPCHWYPAYTLLVTQVCSRARGLNQSVQRPLTDTAARGSQLPASEACRLMTWHHDSTRSCQATGNNNPGTSFSAGTTSESYVYRDRRTSTMSYVTRTTSYVTRTTSYVRRMTRTSYSTSSVRHRTYISILFCM